MKQVKQQKARKPRVEHVGLFTDAVKLVKALVEKAPQAVEFFGPTVRVSFWLTAVVGVMVLVAEVVATK